MASKLMKKNINFNNDLHPVIQAKREVAGF